MTSWGEIMGISLRTNMSSMRAARQIGKSNDKYTESTRSLASGQRINSASQDAGGQSVASTPVWVSIRIVIIRQSYIYST